MIKAIIFDMDGTLVDTIGLHFSVWKKIASEYGIAFTKDMIDEFNGSSTIKIAEAIVKRYNLAADPKEVGDRKSKDATRLLKGGVHLFPDVLDTLVKIKSQGYKIGLATMSSREHMEDSIACRLEGFEFDAIVTDNDVKKPKPDPEIFLRCAELLGVPAAGCIVVEDSINGIIAAKRGGMKAVAITKTTRAEKFPMADAIIEEIGQIDKGFIDKLGGKDG